MDQAIPEEGSHAPIVAEAARASSLETVEAIGAAAEANRDPEVAEILEDAAVAAETTVGRVGWLKGAVSRLFGRPS